MYEEELAQGNIEYDIPPTPPLARANIHLDNSNVQDISEEKWEEGID